MRRFECRRKGARLLHCTEAVAAWGQQAAMELESSESDIQKHQYPDSADMIFTPSSSSAWEGALLLKRHAGDGRRRQ